MNRFHVHVRIANLEQSVRFYSTLFGVEPTVLKLDYAKWMLDDPPVNFAISAGVGLPAIDHLGLQVESRAGLDQIASRLQSAGEVVKEQKNAACCYARGDKGWTADPSGVSWETFYTFGESTVYGNDLAPLDDRASACCPANLPGNTCCGSSPAR
jgi:catechol 2,3-dioxygenase-like lactoylglutathione lyase family enzyme